MIDLNNCSGIARILAASGFGVYAMDFPGFGLSEGLHGYIPSFDDLVEDVIEFHTKIKGMTFYFSNRDITVIVVAIYKISTFVDNDV
jgi:alpha-beta hydrolase superfamily lysophospholipase